MAGAVARESRGYVQTHQPCRRFAIGSESVSCHTRRSQWATDRKRSAGPPTESGITTDFPAYRGLLNAGTLRRVELLERYAAERSVTVLSVALAALATSRSVASLIVGAMSASQLRADVEAAHSWHPTTADLYALKQMVSDLPYATYYSAAIEPAIRSNVYIHTPRTYHEIVGSKPA